MGTEAILDGAVKAAIDDNRIVGAVLLVRRHGANRWGGIYGHHWFIDPSAGLTVVSMSNTGLEGSDGRYRHDTTRAVYAALGL